MTYTLALDLKRPPMSDAEAYIKSRYSLALEGCWIWTGSVYKNGYGRAFLNKTSYRAHRLAFETWHWALRDRDEVVHHHCGSKLCVNPDHLYTGTRAMDESIAQDYIIDRTVVSERGCWEWTEYLNATGYGRCGFAGQTWAAHRLAFTAFVGELGDGFVCHHCDNRRCCNPEHLYLGDNDTNMADKARRERHPFMKISRKQVLVIRERRANGEPLKSIAADYDVTDSAISAIARRKRRTI